MLDINYLKEEDLARKVNLLKQVKTTLESLMFDRGVSSNFAHSFNGLITIFCRYILAILEDGILTPQNQNQQLNQHMVNDVPFLFSSPSSLSSSPASFSASPHFTQQPLVFNSPSSSSSPSSRKTTINSIVNANANYLASQNFWEFILYVFNEYSQILDTRTDKKILTAKNLAQNNFKSIYGEITAKYSNIATSTSNNNAFIDSGAPNDSNLVLEWISVSLRHRILLNQLVYLFSDDNLLIQYYQPNSFVLDRSLVDDFFVYIRAFEEKNYNILNKVKRNFFIVNQSQTLSSQTNDYDKSRQTHRKQNSIDFGSLTLKPSEVIQQIDTFVTNKSIQDLDKTKIEHSSTHSLSNSLIELKINELNRNPKITNHRRMHSFPNIQINMLKKNSMMAANNNCSTTASSSTTEINNTSSKLVRIDSPKSIDDDSNKIDILINDDHISPYFINTAIPNIQLNNEIKEIDDLIKDKDRESLSREFTNDIYEKADILDLIHAVQINCECSPLDKENSHFIMCDLTIAANELMKTQEIEDDFDNFEIKTNSYQPNGNSKNRYINNNNNNNQVSSSSIKINNKSLSSSNLYSSLNSSVTNSCVSTIHNSPQQFFFPLDQTDKFSSIDTTSNSPTESNLNFMEIGHSSNGFGDSSISPKSHSKKSKHKSSFNRSFSNSNSSGLNNINENGLDQSYEYSKLSSSATISASASSNLYGDFVVPEDKDKTPTFQKPEESKNLNVPFNKLEKANKESKRERRYSWEKIEIETAERISVRLIQNAFTMYEQLYSRNKALQIKPNNTYLKLPNLRLLEFFIQYIEYDEFMQNYFELRSSGKLKKYNANLIFHISTPSFSPDLSLLSQSTMNASMSASSIYFSNSSLSTLSESSETKLFTPTGPLLNSKKTPRKDQNTSSIFGSKNNKSNIDKPKLLGGLSAISSISFLKVRSASLAAISAIQLSEKQEILLKSDQHSSDKLLNNPDTNSLCSDSQVSNSMNKSLALVNSSPSPSQSSIYEYLSSGRILGDETWAPVREQLILNYAPKLKRLQQMQQQHFRCADCGIQIKHDQIKTFYYCEYFSKYFCRCCHINSQSYIPAYIVNLLDFRSTFEVSKKAKKFLENIYNEPLITLETINPSLFEHNSIYSKIQKVRIKLYNSRSYINTCRFAVDLKQELESQFDDFIINSVEVYSIETLFKIKRTNYYEILKNLVNRIVEHIKTCLLCSQQGYICGICPKNDLLYPFEFEKVEKCPNCLACYHKNCLKNPEQCPRCMRKRNRMQSGSNILGRSESNAQYIPLTNSNNNNNNNNKVK